MEEAAVVDDAASVMASTERLNQSLLPWEIHGLQLNHTSTATGLSYVTYTNASAARKRGGWELGVVYGGRVWVWGGGVRGRVGCMFERGGVLGVGFGVGECWVGVSPIPRSALCATLDTYNLI
jgi:hypothetical protein